MASFGVLKVVCVVMALSIVVAPLRTVTGLTCGQVTSSLGPCLPYLKGMSPIGAKCCPGVKSLAGLAKTPADKQAACKCLKSIAGGIKGLNYGTAAGLPGKCGVSIPYKISPSTNCATVG